MEHTLRDQTFEDRVAALRRQWSDDPRWAGIERPYGAEDVVRLAGSFGVEHTIARLGAERLRSLLESEDYVAALGAMTATSTTSRRSWPTPRPASVACSTPSS